MGPESSYNMARFKAVGARFTPNTVTETLLPVDGKITPEDANSCYQGDDTDGGPAHPVNEDRRKPAALNGEMF